MAEIIPGNDVVTTLASSINDSTTSVTVTSAAAFPSSGTFRIRIENEIMKVTGVSSNTFTVVRAAEAVNGSATAASHNAGATVVAVITNEQFLAIPSLYPYSNEFYWPPPVPASSALDLDAASQWWRKVGTPTGGVVYTTATGSSIATTYGEDVLKVVAASASDGLKTTWTYANEKRVKSGKYMAVLCAVYVVTSSRTATVSLVTSTPTTIASASVSTIGSWQLVALECGTTALDGSSVDFKVTLDGAGTFYVVPLGALVSNTIYPKAIGLAMRGYVIKWIDATNIYNTGSIADPATWTDLSSGASALSVMALLNAKFYEDSGSTDHIVGFRAKWSTEAIGDTTNAWARVSLQNAITGGIMPVILNDSGVFQYQVDRLSGTGTATLRIALRGYWEWA